MQAVLALLITVAVGWPGTPPGNFVRDATTGEVTRAGTALCTPAPRVAAAQELAICPAAMAIPPPEPAVTSPPPTDAAAPAVRVASAPRGARAPPPPRRM
jgi:hypothetical protein